MFEQRPVSHIFWRIFWGARLAMKGWFSKFLPRNKELYEDSEENDEIWYKRAELRYW